MSCAEVGAELAAEGCVAVDLTDDPPWWPPTAAVCSCTYEDTPCVPEERPYCVDDARVAECVEGRWVYRFCADECETSGACEPDSMVGEGCTCGAWSLGPGT